MANLQCIDAKLVEIVSYAHGLCGTTALIWCIHYPISAIVPTSQWLKPTKTHVCSQDSHRKTLYQCI